MTREDLLRARKRALRAAHVATIGLALAVTPACGGAEEGGASETTSGSGGAGGEQGSTGSQSSSPDGTTLSANGGDGTIETTDAAQDCPEGMPTTRACCDSSRGVFIWSESSETCTYAAIVGPFVPPPMSSC